MASVLESLKIASIADSTIGMPFACALCVREPVGFLPALFVNGNQALPFARAVCMRVVSRFEDGALLGHGTDARPYLFFPSLGTPLMRGISGGEKRRLSIAMELVPGPSILVLDEVCLPTPTTGAGVFCSLSCLGC